METGIPSQTAHSPFHGKILVLIGLAVVSLGAYLLVSRATFRIGFPLDDAWIHQTYARNLALTGTWSFIPGKISGGSTSPLWTVFLAAGDLLHLGPYLWTYFLGLACLVGIAVTAEFAAGRLVEGYHSKFPWIGAFFILEWHLVWAAGSGMETLLYSLLVFWVLVSILVGQGKILLYGLAAGAAAWLRPDGISLLGPVLLGLWLTRIPIRRKIIGTLVVFTGFGLLFLPYLAFNRVIAGSWWPNTFYAKQAEYASLLNTPFVPRFANALALPLIGVGTLLLPGAILFAWKRGWRFPARVIPVLLWFLGYVGMYALRLPVTFQHGRYIQPAMPIFFLVGVIGLLGFITSPAKRRWRWILTRVWTISTAIVLLSFWALGAKSYGVDVASIETELVDTARWISANTPPDSLIAAHDIGAMGYFGHRDLIDLAGLISPEVISIIRDESQLAVMLDRVGADYLMTFPDWYPHLVAGLPVVYQSPGKFAPQQGQPNMRVYRWTDPHQ